MLRAVVPRGRGLGADAKRGHLGLSPRFNDGMEGGNAGPRSLQDAGGTGAGGEDDAELAEDLCLSEANDSLGIALLVRISSKETPSGQNHRDGFSSNPIKASGTL